MGACKIGYLKKSEIRITLFLSQNNSISESIVQYLQAITAHITIHPARANVLRNLTL